MNDGFQKILQQAQQVQESFKKAQNEMLKVSAVGEAGAGMVKVTLNGSHEATKVAIDPMLVRDNPELLEELVAAAITDAARKITATSQDKMRDMAGGFDFPPDFKLPF